MYQFALLTFIILSCTTSAQDVLEGNLNTINRHVEPIESPQKGSLDPLLYVQAQKFMTTSKAFKNITLAKTKLWIDTMYNWDAPKYLQNAFPYYFSGFDYEGRPIWIAEIGKYNIRKVVEQGAEAVEHLEKYLYQGVVRMLKTIHVKDMPGHEIHQSIFLLADFEGMDMSQISHVPTIAFLARMLYTYTDFLFLGVATGIGINANYAAESMFQIARPILGNILSRIEMYGTNKEKWMAALKRTLPPETIPTWYGGSKDFKPLQVYG